MVKYPQYSEEDMRMLLLGDIYGVPAARDAAQAAGAALGCYDGGRLKHYVI